MKKTIHILSGCPGSGKSYFANKLKSEDNYHLRSRDEIRDALREFMGCKEYFPVKANEEWAFWISILTTSIENMEDGDHLIIDQTSCSFGSLTKLITAIRPVLDEENDTIIVRIFDTPLATCLERNAARTGFACVPDSVIYNMHASRLLRCEQTPSEIKDSLAYLYKNTCVSVEEGGTHPHVFIK